MIDTTYLSMAGTFSKSPDMFGMKDGWFATNVMPSYGDYNKSLSSSKIIIRNQKNGFATHEAYIDWICGLGANLLGHSHLGLLEAIEFQLYRGLNFSIVHELEYDVAELLATKVGQRAFSYVSYKDLQVRFMKTGTDACSAAARLARAVTGKDAILSFGYHGWGDAFVAGTPPAHGIPVEYKRNLIQEFQYGDKMSFSVASQAVRGNVAAVIVEHPPYTNVDEREWYAWLRKKCDEIGALLIVDEVVTGFRFGVGGVCELYNIQADLVCYGKALGGGLALSAIMGPRKYMEWFSRNDPVFVSSTQFGETLPLAAARYMLEYWDDDKVLAISRLGQKLINELKPYYDIYGHAQRSLFKFENEYERAFFIQGMLQRGILMNRPNFPNLAMTNSDVEKTIAAAIELHKIRERVSDNAIEKAMKPFLPKILFKNR